MFLFIFNLWQHRTDRGPPMHLWCRELPFSSSPSPQPLPTSCPIEEYFRCKLNMPRGLLFMKCLIGLRTGGRLDTADRLSGSPCNSSPLSCSLPMLLVRRNWMPAGPLTVPGLGAVMAEGSHQGAIEDWCLALYGQERQGTHSGTGTFQSVSSVRFSRGRECGDRRKKC